MLYFIGLGLADEKDLSVKGLEIIEKSDKIFLESYTSKLLVNKEKLESFYQKEIILADRDLVEKKSDEILNMAKDKEVCFLVVGDPFGATTHSDLFLRAKKSGIKIKIIHNASIINAVGETGLELYKFGKTTSIPFPMKSFRPKTPYEVLEQNKKQDLHTLMLLDIKAKENKFMTVNWAIEYLLDLEKEIKRNVFNEDTLCVGLARLGSEDSLIVSGKAKELLKYDFGKPLHSLIVPGNLHFVEEEMLNQFNIVNYKS